jgi:hypothetical protein
MTNTILQIHNWLAVVLFLTALVAIFVPKARQLVDYVLALQIVLGVAVWGILKVAPPAAHWILAIAVGGVWPMARALERKGRPPVAVMGVAGLGVVILAIVIYLGTKAVKG